MLETQSRAKATIAVRTIQQIKPIEWTVNPASGSMLAYSGSTYIWKTTGSQNTALGYQAGLFNVGTGISQNAAPSNIQFNAAQNKPVLTITEDGDVIWSGKPSEAADVLVQSFQFAVEDKKGVTKAARRRYYLKACQNILNKAERMSHEEFIDFLQKHVYNKERRVIVDALQGRQ